MKVFDQVPENQERRFRLLLPYAKSILGILVLVALLSYSKLDPGLLNLLSPSAGIHNWLGMPGALVAGFLMDFCGFSAMLLPVFLTVLDHQDHVTRPQAVLLDVSMICLLIIGVAHLVAVFSYPVIRLTGLLGDMATIYLQRFPGSLITLLVVFGFVLRYARYYRFNRYTAQLFQQLFGVLLLSASYLTSIFSSPLTRLLRWLERSVLPVSLVSPGKLSHIKQRTWKGWQTLTENINSWFATLNPSYRMSDRDMALPGKDRLSEELMKEIEHRELLRSTVEEYEKRIAGETR